MDAEAQPSVTALGLAKDEPSHIASPAPVVTYTGTVREATVYLACNGILLIISGKASAEILYADTQ